MIKLFIKLILLLVIIAVLILGYLGFVPGISNVFGSNKPRDLKVSFTAEDTKRVDDKVGIIYEKIDPATSSGSISLGTPKPFVADFTNEEMTALISEHGKAWKDYPFTSVQVKFNADGTAEASGILRVDRLDGYLKSSGLLSNDGYKKGVEYVKKFSGFTGNPAFYIKGRVDIKNSQYSGGIDQLVIGRLPVPVEKLTNDKAMMNLAYDLLKVVGVSVKEAHFSDGKLSVDAQIPQSVKLLAE